MNTAQAKTDDVPTKEKLLSLVDDIELISKELIENSVKPKQNKMSGTDHDALSQLLVEKDRELKQTMALASRQGEVEKNIQALNVQVKKLDDAIKELQKKFKDAETVLATAIFQANQKLDSISRAKESPVSSEELIKYAHRISASNAVCAPLNWQQGDPRRPYPTDMEMRNGFLGRMGEGGGGGGGGAGLGWPIGASPAPTQVAPSPKMQPPPSTAAAAAVGIVGAQSHQHQQPATMTGPPTGFAWQANSGEMTMTMKDGSTVPIETAGGASRHSDAPAAAAAGGGGGEVDVMSTDSSSSSSTDSN